VHLATVSNTIIEYRIRNLKVQSIRDVFVLHVIFNYWNIVEEKVQSAKCGLS